MLGYTIVQSDSVKQSELGRCCYIVPREPPLPQASVSRNLLGVVVPDPGVPGRREGVVGVSLRRFRGKGQGPPLRSWELRKGCLPGETLHVEPAPLRTSQPALERGQGRRGQIQAGECGRGKKSAGPRGPAVPGPSPPPQPQPPLCFVSAGPRRCDSHFRSWGAGEPGGEGRGGCAGRGGGRAAREAPRGRARPGARVVPVTSRRPLPPVTLLGCPPCFAATPRSESPDPDAPGISRDDAPYPCQLSDALSFPSSGLSRIVLQLR